MVRAPRQAPANHPKIFGSLPVRGAGKMDRTRRCCDRYGSRIGDRPGYGPGAASRGLFSGPCRPPTRGAGGDHRSIGLRWFPSPRGTDRRDRPVLRPRAVRGDRPGLRPGRRPVQQRGVGSPAGPARRPVGRGLAAGCRRQPDRPIPLHSRGVPGDEGPGPSRRPDHQQRVDLGPRPQARLRPLHGDQARHHRPGPNRPVSTAGLTTSPAARSISATPKPR